MKTILTSVAILGLALSAAAGELKRNLQDEAALTTFASEFAVAWNRHDPKVITAFFTPDASLINPMGREAHGAAKIEELITEEQAGVMKNSILKTAVTRPIQWLNQEIAVVTWDATLKGMAGRPAPTDHIVTVVMVKYKEPKAKEGKWLCATARPMIPVAAPAPPAAK